MRMRINVRRPVNIRAVINRGGGTASASATQHAPIVQHQGRSVDPDDAPGSDPEQSGSEDGSVEHH